MKKIHKGQISISASGVVKVSGGTYPQIRVEGLSIEEEAQKQLGIDPQKYEDAKFNGKVSIIIECTSEEPEIKNTMVEPEDESKEVSEEENVF